MMAEVAWGATLQAAQEGSLSHEIERTRASGAALTVHVTIVSPRAVHRDGDNALGGLKTAFDGISRALHINDARFRYPPVVFAKGPGDTLIRASAE